MYPDFEAMPKLPVGAPVKKTSLKFTLGKMSTGGIVLPVAFIIPQSVICSPLSAEATFPTCFLPVGAIT